MSDLEKCPFCGADQNVDHEYADYVLSPNMKVAYKSCWNCGATAPGVWLDEYGSEEEWQEAADALWNIGTRGQVTANERAD